MKYSFKICFISCFAFLFASVTYGTAVECRTDDYDILQGGTGLNYDVILLPKPYQHRHEDISSSSSSESDDKKEIHLQHNKHFHEHNHHHVHVNLPSSEESSPSEHHYQFVGIPEGRRGSKEELECEEEEEEEEHHFIPEKSHKRFHYDFPEEIITEPKKEQRKLDIIMESIPSKPRLEFHRPRPDIRSCLVKDDWSFLKNHLRSLEEHEVSEEDLSYLKKHLHSIERDHISDEDKSWHL